MKPEHTTSPTYENEPTATLPVYRTEPGHTTTVHLDMLPLWLAMEGSLVMRLHLGAQLVMAIQPCSGSHDGEYPVPVVSAGGESHTFQLHY